MIDPWADVRERVNDLEGKAYNMTGPPEVYDFINHIPQDIRQLLADADALLAVVPLVNEAVDAYELPIDVEQTLRDWLAALPEHLNRAP